MNDPLDQMGPDELIEEASKHLLFALAKLDDMRRVLRGEPVPPRQERLNVVFLSARSTCRHRERRNHKRTGKRPGDHARS